MIWARNHEHLGSSQNPVLPFAIFLTVGLELLFGKSHSVGKFAFRKICTEKVPSSSARTFSELVDHEHAIVLVVKR